MREVELMNLAETELKAAFKPNDVVWVPVPGVLKPAIVEKVIGAIGRSVMYEVEYCLGEHWEIEEFAESQLRPYYPREAIRACYYDRSAVEYHNSL